jgi:hypothetical protein
MPTSHKIMAFRHILMANRHKLLDYERKTAFCINIEDYERMLKKGAKQLAPYVRLLP